MSALLLPALAAGSSGQGAPYVDDVFSTYLYTGNGSTQTINNGIDLAGKGGLVWIKGRSGATDHALYDTLRGATFDLVSNSQAAQTTQATGLTAFSNTGFSVGSLAKLNTSAATYTSWTFRRAPKFFDIVTWVGNGDLARVIPHSLGVAPAMVIVKKVSVSPNPGRWVVSHRLTNGSASFLYLDSAGGTIQADVISNGCGYCYIQANDSKNLFIHHSQNNSVNDVNEAGQAYVAYTFAHDPSAEGIVQCGGYTGNGSATGPAVTLGWEPQYLMIKNETGAVGNWQIIDSMRGMSAGSSDATLQANLASAETSVDYVSLTPAGFQVASASSEVNTSGQRYIYLAIRRPNKPPKTGAEVYAASSASGVVNTGFPIDLHIGAVRAGAANNHAAHARLTGGTKELATSSTAVESTITDLGFDSMIGLRASLSAAGINHFFRRAPCFFDVVCDTGTGAAHAITHNLTKAPELIICKSRSAATQWEVWHSALTATEKLVLNSNAAKVTDTAAWNSTPPTATQFTVGTGANVNANAATFVTYLFATLPGISKVGSYTGNGTSQTIDCGFSTGARFFLVKATSTTGSWWVYDSARGIVSAADPALQLNSTAAEITSADAVDPASVGIIVNQEATCSINATGVSYIFLAIA